MTSVALPGPVKPARFLDRPNSNRVRVTVEPEEQVVEAELPPLGRLGDLRPGSRVWIKVSADQRRWVAMLAQSPGGPLVSLDPNASKTLIRTAIEEEAIDELAGFEFERQDVPFGTSRFDLELRSSIGQRAIVDIKSVVATENGVGLFPSAKSDRETRQVRSLARLVASEPGTTGAIVFVAQRIDTTKIVAARHLDPNFVVALHEARQAGVRILGRRCQVTLEELVLGVPVEVVIPAANT